MPPKKKDTDSSKKSLKDTLAELRKSGTRIGFAEVKAEPRFLTTGNMSIDALSNGGFPVGKIVELAGPPASGKTTAAISAAARVIQEGGTVAFFDYERAIDKPYFRALGVEPDDEETFLYFTPQTLEEGANICRKLVETGELSLAIFDSVAAMVTEHEKTADTGKVMVGDRAKMLHQFLRQIKDNLSDAETTLVFLNHLLEKVDITYMGQQLAARGIKQYTSPGGKAIPFYASLRLRFELVTDLTREEFNPLLNEKAKIKVGSKHRVTVIKNKVGKPGGVAEVINVMGEGFSQIRTAIELLLKYGAIKKSGAWFSAKEARLVEVMTDKQIQGEDNLIDYIAHSAVRRAIAITVATNLLHQAIAAQSIEVEDLESVEELPDELVDQVGVFNGVA